MKDIKNQPKYIGSFFAEGYHYNVYVYSDEDKTAVPHFHLLNNLGEEISICIYQPLYFSHDNKHRLLKISILNYLINWLNETSKTCNKITHWESIELMWISGNGNKNIPENRIMPDYSLLKEIIL